MKLWSISDRRKTLGEQKQVALAKSLATAEQLCIDAPGGSCNGPALPNCASTLSGERICLLLLQKLLWLKARESDQLPGLQLQANGMPQLKHLCQCRAEFSHLICNTMPQICLFGIFISLFDGCFFIWQTAASSAEHQAEYSIGSRAIVKVPFLQ